MIGWKARIIKLALLMGIIGMVLCVCGSPALASSDEHSGEGEHHAVPFGKPMVFSIINFALLVGLFVYIYRKNLSGGFEKRSLEIKAAMDAAAAAKQKAEEKYQEYKARIAGLDAEIGALIDGAKADALKEQDAIIAEAGRQAEKMVKQAELTASHEVETAKRELRREAAALAAEMAADILKKAITPEDQQKWVKSYIEKIGEVQ